MLMARLYPHIFSKEILAQRAITSQISLEQKIDDFWIAKCEIPLIPGLQEDCKIELYEVWTWEDLLVFSGFIYETRPLRKRWDMLEITARDFKAIFQKRKVGIGKTGLLSRRPYRNSWGIIMKNTRSSEHGLASMRLLKLRSNRGIPMRIYFEKSAKNLNATEQLLMAR